MTVLYVLLSILLIGILVLVHEAGHYTAARLTGLPVHEFAIGFGKRIWSREKNGILYSLRLIPFGGFVSFADTEDEKGLEKYYSVAVWKRLIVSAAGSFTNILFAFVVLIIFSMAGGIHDGAKQTPVLSAVSAGSAAEQAGIKPGDKILTVAGVTIGDDISLITKTIGASDGKPIDITLERDGKQMSVVVTPQYNDAEKRYMIGVTPGQVLGPPVYMSFGEAVSYSLVTMVNAVKEILVFLFGLFTQGKGAGDMTTPIGIVSQMTTLAQQYGSATLINIAVFLSVNLGVFNLLPLPALDGSKIVFLIVEAIRRKPVPPDKEGMVQFVGFALFIVLFVFLAGRDIARLFGWVA